MANYFYCIANFYIKIDFKHLAHEQFKVPTQYAPFKISQDQCGPVVFSLVVDDNFIFKEKGNSVGHFHSGENRQDLYIMDDGSYQIEVYDEQDKVCWIQTNRDFTTAVGAFAGSSVQYALGFNNAMMIGFAFATATRGCLLMHASVSTYLDKGYLFLGKSGTGKSTHSELWINNFKGAQLLNDDNPALRIINGCALVYGTPWSGKRPCYRNECVSVGAMVMLTQKPYNKIEQRRVIDNFACLLSSCSSMTWDRRIYDAICQNLSEIMKVVPIYFMDCLPNDEAAYICKEAIVK